MLSEYCISNLKTAVVTQKCCCNAAAGIFTYVFRVLCDIHFAAVSNSKHDRLKTRRGRCPFVVTCTRRVNRTRQVGPTLRLKKSSPTF